MGLPGLHTSAMARLVNTAEVGLVHQIEQIRGFAKRHETIVGNDACSLEAQYGYYAGQPLARPGATLRDFIEDTTIAQDISGKIAVLLLKVEGSSGPWEQAGGCPYFSDGQPTG